jgi:hypothetical protein
VDQDPHTLEDRLHEMCGDDDPSPSEFTSLLYFVCVWMTISETKRVCVAVFSLRFTMDSTYALPTLVFSGAVLVFILRRWWMSRRGAHRQHQRPRPRQHQRPRPRQAPEECKRQQQHPRSRSGKAVGNAHVYVDNSNVFLGAKNASGRTDPLVRVNVSALVALVEGRAGCVVKTRLVGGSSPAASSPMWNRYRDAGYSVALADPRRREVFVDDMIVGQINHKILESGSTPQTLVLLSGDGNSNYGRASFVDVVKNALERKWAVHLWAWSNSLSAVYRRMATANSSLHIFLLDGHAKTIVFRTRGPRAVAVVNGRARSCVLL